MKKIEGNDKIIFLMNYDSKKTLLENQEVVEQNIGAGTAIGVGTGAAAGGATGAAVGAVGTAAGYTGLSGTAASIGASLGASTAVAAAGIGGAVLGGLTALALVPLAMWFIDKDSAKNKVDRMFNFCKTDGEKIKKLQRGVDDTTIRNLSDQLFDAMNGVGTDEEKVYQAFNALQTASDFCALVDRFNLDNGDLLEWLDDDFDQTNEWMKIFRPIRNVVEDSLKKIAEQEQQKEKPAPTKSKYVVCSDFPFKQFCKSEIIRQIQTAILMPEKYRTSYFGPITLTALKTFVQKNNIPAEDAVGLSKNPPEIDQALYNTILRYKENMEKIPETKTELPDLGKEIINKGQQAPEINPNATNQKMIQENVDDIKNMFKKLQ